MSVVKKLNRDYVVKESNANISVKDVDTTSRIVTGYFNSFNFVDSDMDVIRKGSFKQSINERGPDSSGKAKIKHLLFHDFSKIVGRPHVLKEDNMGEYFETKMPDTQDGNDTLIKYQEGIYDNHSIGFRYVNGKIFLITDEDEDFEKMLDGIINPEVAIERGFFYNITEVKQHEGSTVGIGANEMTPFLGVKSSDSIDIKILKAKEKIDIMAKELRHGRSSDEAMIDFEAQTNQLKEFICNLLAPNEADVKSFAERQSRKPSTESIGKYKHLL